jgi:hypothetical protein
MVLSLSHAHMLALPQGTKERPGVAQASLELVM